MVPLPIHGRADHFGQNVRQQYARIFWNARHLYPASWYRASSKRFSVAWLMANSLSARDFLGVEAHQNIPKRRGKSCLSDTRLDWPKFLVMGLTVMPKISKIAPATRLA